MTFNSNDLINRYNMHYGKEKIHADETN